MCLKPKYEPKLQIDSHQEKKQSDIQVLLSYYYHHCHHRQRHRHHILT